MYIHYMYIYTHICVLSIIYHMFVCVYTSLSLYEIYIYIYVKGYVTISSNIQYTSNIV